MHVLIDGQPYRPENLPALLALLESKYKHSAALTNPVQVVIEDEGFVSFRYRRVITRLHSVIDRTLVHQQTA